MKQTHVLVVDDDPKIRTLLRNCFEGEGFLVLEASDRAATLAVIGGEKVHLITLDLHLGADDGLELAREIRKTSQVPIVMLTGKDDVIDRVVGLEVGADDYITKPFHVRELLARVRSVLRRSTTGNGHAAGQGDTRHGAVRFDGLTALPDKMELRDRDGAVCDLTSGDYKLLSVFLENPKRALSRDRLMDLINGQDWTPLDRTIDNQVARLRKKIERDPAEPLLIKTVRGVGYMLACDLEVVQDYADAKIA